MQTELDRWKEFITESSGIDNPLEEITDAMVKLFDYADNAHPDEYWNIIEDLREQLGKLQRYVYQ